MGIALFLIRVHRRISIALLLTQLALYCCASVSLALFLTNLLTIFVICVEIKRLDTHEMFRLNAAWRANDRLRCLIRVFTLALLSALRFLLAKMIEVSPKTKAENSVAFYTQSIYYLLLIISFWENSLLFCRILDCTRSKRSSVGFAHDWRRRNGMFLSAAAA